MNTRFFDVKKAKQDAVINAALKIFALNGYKNASTDVIVKEAGISKGLLFHYFGSKQGLYEFIYDYSVKYMTLELTRTVSKAEKDFFTVQVQLTRAKTRVMKNYPYMEQFINNSRLETDPEAVACIGELKDVMKETYNNIYSQTDNTRFMDRLDIGDVINMITWMSDGFIRDKFRNSEFNLDDMNEEFEKFLNLLRRHFYRSPGNDMVSMAREEMVERNEDVMDEMRLKAVYEEKRKQSSVSAPIFASEDSDSNDEADDKIKSVETMDSVDVEDNAPSEAEIDADEIKYSAQEEAEDGVQYVRMSTDYESGRKSERYSEISDDVTLEEISKEQDRLAEEYSDNAADDSQEIEEEDTAEEAVAQEEIEEQPQQRIYVEKPDLSLFPSWWLQSEPESAAATEPETMDGYEMMPATDMMPATEGVQYVDNSGYVQGEQYASEYTAEPEQPAEYVSTQGMIPTVSNDVFMPDFNVPEDLLHSTLKNLTDGEEDEDDDDEAWAPRPVRQIRL